MADITLHPDSLRSLETLVENFGLEGILAGLVHICRENANRARNSLADDYKANLWDRDATTLASAQARVHH